MAQVVFTPHLSRHVACPDGQIEGGTVRQVLDAAFRLRPAARSYVLDDQGALRTHIQVFVDGAMCADRTGLSDPVRPETEIFVMQALSGG